MNTRLFTALCCAVLCLAGLAVGASLTAHPSSASALSAPATETAVDAIGTAADVADADPDPAPGTAPGDGGDASGVGAPRPSTGSHLDDTNGSLLGSLGAAGALIVMGVVALLIRRSELHAGGPRAPRR